jgi:hypothetical protein
VDEEIIAQIDRQIQSHDNDPEAHGLAVLRQHMDLLDSRTGVWSVEASDSFDGADGPLTTAPVGGQTWVGGGISRIDHAARATTGALGGVYLVTSAADGQVEADLNPGDGEASFYIRYASTGNYLLLQRKPDSFIGLFRILGGVTTLVDVASAYRPVVAGERFKVRFIGSQLWVLRVADAVEELLFKVTEANFLDARSHGLRLSGTGAAKNFRILKREAI